MGAGLPAAAEGVPKGMPRARLLLPPLLRLAPAATRRSLQLDSNHTTSRCCLRAHYHLEDCAKPVLMPVCNNPLQSCCSSVPTTTSRNMQSGGLSPRTKYRSTPGLMPRSGR